MRTLLILRLASETSYSYTALLPSISGGFHRSRTQLGPTCRSDSSHR